MTDSIGTEEAGVRLDALDVLGLLPHRYPMLLVDRLENVVPYASAVGIKNVTINEPFFQGHFPSHPIMPGVLIVEAMGQTAAALVAHSVEGGLHGKLVYFAAIDRARFRQPVVPGDCLRMPVQKVKAIGPIWKFRGEARVNGELVAEAEYTAKIIG